jgi:hypothetical protein
MCFVIKNVKDAVLLCITFVKLCMDIISKCSNIEVIYPKTYFYVIYKRQTGEK